MRKIKLAALLTVLILLIGSLCACNNLSQHELDAVGKYNLTTVSGTDSLTAADYDYNYITLKNNGTFVIENKSQEVVSTSSGKWSLSGETLTLKLSGLLSKKETHTLKEGKITLSGKIGDTETTLVFTRE